MKTNDNKRFSYKATNFLYSHNRATESFNGLTLKKLLICGYEANSFPRIKSILRIACCHCIHQHTMKIMGIPRTPANYGVLNLNWNRYIDNCITAPGAGAEYDVYFG